MNEQRSSPAETGQSPEAREPRAPVSGRKRAGLLGRRQVRRGGQSVALTVAIIGILVLLNILAGRAGWQADLSAEGRFTLSPQSLQVVKQLQEPVQVTAFVSGGSTGVLVDLLNQYARSGDRFRLRLVDPVKEPSVARQYEITQYDTVILEQGSRLRRVEPTSLYALGSSQTEVEFRGEEAITRALLELGREQVLTVYFLTGHGEGTPSDRLEGLARRLQGEGFTVETLNLAQAGSVPEGATALVAAGPRSDLDAREREEIQKYLARGGRLAVLIDPSDRELAGWNALLEELGVRIRTDVVVDPVQSFFLDPLSPMPTLRFHDITRDLQENRMRVVLPGARSLEVLPAGEREYSVVTLLETSFDAWGETTLRGTSLSKDPEDVSGPLALAVAISRPAAAASSGGGGSASESDAASEAVQGPEASGESPRTQDPAAVVVGSAAFLESQMLGVQGNQDFFMNALDWLVGEEHLISIRPRILGAPTVDLTRRLITQVFYGFVVALPVAVLALGGFLWWRRRAL